jgi:hypothetical protein
MFFDEVIRDIRTYFLISAIQQACQVTDSWGAGKSQSFRQYKKLRSSEVGTSKALIIAPPSNSLP